MLLNEINQNLVQRYGIERLNAILNRNISYLTHHIPGAKAVHTVSR